MNHRSNIDRDEEKDMAEPTSGRVTGLAVDPSDPSRPDDTFIFNDAYKTGLPSSETFLQAVQLEPVNDFANAQPFVPDHDLPYSNSFTCIPDSVPF